MPTKERHIRKIKMPPEQKRQMEELQPDITEVKRAIEGLKALGFDTSMLEERAEKAVRQLHKRAINAVYCVIKGQPDNYHLENLEAMCKTAHEQALNGRILRFEGHSIYPFTMV